METIVLKFLEFDDLHEENKKLVMKHYFRCILPKLIERQYRLVYDCAWKNGIFINSINLSEIKGRFELLPEIVLEKVVENGLVYENDSQYVSYKVLYEDIRKIDKEIEGLKVKNETDKLDSLYEKRFQLYEDWKNKFLKFILDKLLRRLQEEVVFMDSWAYARQFFYSNNYVFSDDCLEVFQIVGGHVYFRFELYVHYFDLSDSVYD